MGKKKIPWEKAIGEFLRGRKASLALAESCTGGLVSDRITDVPGSSDYFEGAIVSYSLKAKAKYLGLSLTYLKRYGAVSGTVARKMAEGVRKAFGATYGLSTTGVAGPTGGTERTPVGTVFIGFSDGRRSIALREQFNGGRRAVKKQASERALQWLYETLRSSQSKGEHRSNTPCLGGPPRTMKTLPVSSQPPRRLDRVSSS